ncbi:ABC transporter ATP-binding protein [Amycolatopsis cihanbeyliensis]|uniref:ABC transporter ATP-binding protein n=1 Tax=Amycolatopsis cihanbeyliensis TaxID=1128664 RepID=UPI001B87976D|nr:ABC transporter ATP-binding protein [Amycolatopsis cihanbeyliensis]
MVTALDSLSLDVPSGEVHGLLGPNGSGKTTLCRILSTVLTPTSGTAHVLGYNVVTEAADVRARLGIVFGGERGLYWKLTGRQNLQYWAALYKVPSAVARQRAQKLLDRVGLGTEANDLVETYSRGMKQRLHLARGLIGRPKLVVFDEPTIGMDPVAAHDFRELITELRTEGCTVLLTTHDMAEAEAVCDRVTLIGGGRVLATETPRGLARLSAGHHWVEADDIDIDVAHLPGVVEVVRQGAVTRVKTDSEGAARGVLDFLLGRGVRTVRIVPPTLADVYLDLFGARGMEV